MTLVEALNGPVSHIQSCVIPPSPATPCDVDNSHSFPFVKETSEKGISLQQVKVLTANSVTDEGENPVYIEMDTTKITSDRPLSILVDETSSFGKPSLNRTTSSPSTMSHGSYALTVTEKDEVDEIQENHQLRSDDQDMKTEAVASESDHRSMSHTTVPRSSSMPTRVTVLNRKGARNMENSSEDR
ncbi:hypothetical protein AB6A40_006510 [Gnathostoma spinigerum]|uniref:Uncharacterized protein n=1 Tax=Gnathostoma spinigerum TaxID=75299 RepID=A0ABD6EKN3_9BILA